MRAVLAIFIFAALQTGCSTFPRYTQICPQACKPVVDDQSGGENGSVSDAWMAYDERLRKQNIFYWLTNSKGQPVELYDYKHDRGIFESPWQTITTTKENPKPVREPFILKRKTSDVVIHLIRVDGEETIYLRDATLEHHTGFDVLYVE
jgi:hypothetical protein